MTFRPLGCRIVVRLDDRRASYTLGGFHPAGAVSAPTSTIIAPDDWQETPCTGVVVAVGPGIPESPMAHLGLVPGMRVQLGKFNGTPIPSDYFDEPGEYVVLDARHDKPTPHVPDVFGELINDGALES